MKLNTSFKKFKQLHKKKYNQAVHFSFKCNNYAFVENLYKFILVQKNSFIFESVEKGKIRGRYTIIGFNPDKILNIKKNVIVEDDFKKKKIINKNMFINSLNFFLRKYPISVLSIVKRSNKLKNFLQSLMFTKLLQ